MTGEEELNVGILLDTSAARSQLADVQRQSALADSAVTEVAAKANADLHEIEQKNLKAQMDLHTTKAMARDTWMTTISVVRNSWGILRGILKASGVTISAVTNAVVESILHMGSVWIKLATAEAVTPGMQAAAVITMIQAGIIIGTAYAMEKQQTEALRQIESTNLILTNMTQTIGNLNF